MNCNKRSKARLQSRKEEIQPIQRAQTVVRRDGDAGCQSFCHDTVARRSIRRREINEPARTYDQPGTRVL